MKLSVLIPVYNEARTINTVILEVKSVQLPAGITKEIIVVDDGSTDGTHEELERYRGDPEIKIVRKGGRAGKSSAVRTGIDMSTGDIMLIQDADLEYSPRDYPRLLEPILRGEASVVYGSRFRAKTAVMPLINRLANIASSMTFNFLYGVRLDDPHTCLKVIRTDAIRGIDFTPRHFVFDIEITVALIKRGYKICEVPVGYVARTRKEGKKLTWQQAVELYWNIIQFRFKHNEPH